MTGRSLLLVSVVGAWSWTAPDARAALGGDVASVAADATAMNGAHAVTTLPTHAVHDIAAAGGLRIREFVDTGGRVFAVSWSGPALPDLQRLLGGEYDTFAATLAARPPAPARQALHVAAAGLVVDNEGTVRAVAGRAYLPDRVPAGVALADVR